jgi:hypothetical protein
VSLAGWSTTNVGDLSIEGRDGVIRFWFECSTAQLTGVAGFFDVTGVSGYIKGNIELGAPPGDGGK